jgi:hypothetical protein
MINPCACGGGVAFFALSAEYLPPLSVSASFSIVPQLRWISRFAC